MPLESSSALTHNRGVPVSPGPARTCPKRHGGGAHSAHPQAEARLGGVLCRGFHLARPKLFILFLGGGGLLWPRLALN